MITSSLLFVIIVNCLSSLSAVVLRFQDVAIGNISFVPTAQPKALIGNKLFAPEQRLNYSLVSNQSSIPTTATGRLVRVVIFSVWIGDSVDVERSNHYLYAKERGYDYIHVAASQTEYEAVFGSSPAGWASVIVAQQLMLHIPTIDYLLKMDQDCIFARSDLAIEAAIDPLEQFHLYTSQIEHHSRFSQSHTWIIRNSEYSQMLLREWLEYRVWGRCVNIAQEQGAFHFVLGWSLHLAYPHTSDFSCVHYCNSLRSAYHHHHCVLDWYTDNGFGLENEGSFTHPYVFLYPRHSPDHFHSPDDGYTVETTAAVAFAKAMLTSDKFAPFTVHPCKKNFYIPPDKVAERIESCFGHHTGRRLIRQR